MIVGTVDCDSRDIAFPENGNMILTPGPPPDL